MIKKYFESGSCSTVSPKDQPKARGHCQVTEQSHEQDLTVAKSQRKTEREGNMKNP